MRFLSYLLDKVIFLRLMIQTNNPMTGFDCSVFSYGQFRQHPGAIFRFLSFLFMGSDDLVNLYYKIFSDKNQPETRKIFPAQPTKTPGTEKLPKQFGQVQVLSALTEPDCLVWRQGNSFFRAFPVGEQRCSVSFSLSRAVFSVAFLSVAPAGFNCLSTVVDVAVNKRRLCGCLRGHFFPYLQRYKVLILLGFCCSRKQKAPETIYLSFPGGFACYTYFLSLISSRTIFAASSRSTAQKLIVFSSFFRFRFFQFTGHRLSNHSSQGQQGNLERGHSRNGSCGAINLREIFVTYLSMYLLRPPSRKLVNGLRNIIPLGAGTAGNE